MRLRLPLRRVPDPELTPDELDALEELLRRRLEEIDAIEALLSESTIRERMDLKSIRAKVRLVIESWR